MRGGGVRFQYVGQRLIPHCRKAGLEEEFNALDLKHSARRHNQLLKLHISAVSDFFPLS